MTNKSLQASPEQILYARILEIGMYCGLLLIIITYLIYVLGIIKPFLPLSEVPRLWSVNVRVYLQETHIQTGWAWLGMIRYSDFLNFIPIAILAGVTIPCFVVLIPVLWKQDDKLYAILTIVEVIVLSVAASGILGTKGHH
jgi:hypothetical protein